MRAVPRGTKDFWAAMLGTLAVILAVLGIWRAQNPSWRMPLPSPFELFSAFPAYKLPHPLFYYGIYGFRARIKESDVLLVGTSHVEVGLSAGELSRLLSEALKRPVKVFNLGRGYADGYAFTRAILDENDVRNKIVITDLYDPQQSGLSQYAIDVEHYGRRQAYLIVAREWMSYVVGLLQSYVAPQIEWTSTGFDLKPALADNDLRRYDNGDVQSFWIGKSGDIFDQSRQPGPLDITPEDKKALPSPDETRQFNDRAYCQSRGLICLYTLIPYYGPGGAAIDTFNVDTFVAEHGLRYLPISSDDLTFIDKRVHLDSAAREKATRRLADQLIPFLRARVSQQGAGTTLTPSSEPVD